MSAVKVNLLSDSGAAGALPPKKTSRSLAWLLSCLVLFIGSFAFGRLSLSNDTLNTIGNFTDIPLISQVRHLIGSPDRKLQGEPDDRINVLLLGMGGESHDGPNLTDTVIIASFKPSTNDVALLSIPRDLLIPIDGHSWQKINAANVFGEKEDPGNGGDYARKVIEGVLDIDIPYYVRIDFQGFRSVVDAAGGVDLYIDRSFTDNTYPTNDYKTQTISFTKGWTHMDGETALRFARSRHGNAGEGTDFARAKRQQKVIDALKEKLLTLGTYRNPATVTDLLSSLRANIRTNFQLGEIVRLVRTGQNIGELTIRQKVVDNSASSPLVESTYGGAYVLVPRGDDWSKLRDVAANIFAVAESTGDAPTNKPVAAPINSKIEIQNGSGRQGLARTVATKVTPSGFEVVRIGNAASDQPKTTIEDYTDGANPNAIAQLQAAVARAVGLPEGTVPKVTKRKTGANESRTAAVEFLVVLGEDAANNQ